MRIFSEKRTESGANPAAGGSEPEERDVSLPLYVSACVVQLAALVAVGYQSDSTNFTYFTIVMTLLGFATSFYLRKFGVPSETVKVGAIVLALLFLYGLRSLGFLGLSSLQQVGSSQEIVLVSILALTATFCSFLLLTDDAVIFPCVWAIALIGLTGTVNINIELIVCFVVFFCAAIFLLVHQSHLARQKRFALSLGEDAPPMPLRRNALPLLRTQLTVAAVCAVASLIIGFIIAIPTQMLGRNLSINQFLRRLRVAPSAVPRVANRPTLTFDNFQDFQVGLGPIGGDPHKVLTVRAARPFYWRGRTYSEYTGQGWASSFTGDATALTPIAPANADGLATFRVPPGEFANRRKKTQQMRFEFRTEGTSLRPMYHVSEPVLVEAPTGTVNVRPSNTITGVGEGSRYNVVAAVTTATENDLRRSGREYPPGIRDRYLSIPDPNEAVRSLALQAVAGARDTPYDRAEAVRRFVAERCVYTLEARAVPNGRDAAEFFLNESREGYCDLYATATTILCRYAGLPARVATGFVPGTPSDTEPNTYVLTGDDRHAWTEVYYNDYGWIQLDATVDTGGVAPVAHSQERKVQKPWWERIGVFPLVFSGLGALLLLYALGNELYSRFARPTRARRIAGNPFAYQIVRAYQNAEKQTARRSGITRSDTLTPREYVKRVRQEYSEAVADALLPLTLLLERALYSPAAATAQDVGTAKSHVSALKTALRGTKRS